MKNILLGLSLGLLLFLAGCGDGGTGNGTAGTAGTAGTGGSGATGGSAGSGGSGGGGATGGSAGSTGAPLAPTLDSVGPLEGGLHVMWTNNTPDCDKIELDRKKDDGMFAVAYTLTGAATSQHDSDATAPGMYCYKARCIKGMETSPDSNEKCASP
jgi:hypothetical protein